MQEEGNTESIIGPRSEGDSLRVLRIERFVAFFFHIRQWFKSVVFTH